MLKIGPSKRISPAYSPLPWVFYRIKVWALIAPFWNTNLPVFLSQSRSFVALDLLFLVVIVLKGFQDVDSVLSSPCFTQGVVGWWIRVFFWGGGWWTSLFLYKSYLQHWPSECSTMFYHLRRPQHMSHTVLDDFIHLVWEKSSLQLPHSTQHWPVEDTRDCPDTQTAIITNHY